MDLKHREEEIMKHLKHRITKQELERVFRHPEMRPNQKEAFKAILENGSVVLELPTGSGKTDIGMAVLLALKNQREKPVFYITPTKALVDQAKNMYPSDVRVVYGRNEYQCLYYTDKYVSAEEAPCSMLDCPHRVNQETGETEDSVVPCPYLWAKYEAKQGGIVVCTMAFYLFTQLFSKEWGEPAGLVVDEVHHFAKVVRNCLSYEITDYQLERTVNFLKEIGVVKETEILENFLRKIREIIRCRPPRTATLLEPHEIQDLLIDLYKIDPIEFRGQIRKAVRERVIEPTERRETLKRLEVITRNLTRYLKSLEFSLPRDRHQPLNYSYGYYEAERGEKERVQYRLVIKAYYVVPLIRKILSPFTIAYSATVGDAEVLNWESGIEAPFYTFPSDFPTENARIFIPTDTPNLAVKARKKRDPVITLRRITEACQTLSKSHLRSLVVVVSNLELRKFKEICQRMNVNAISYGNGISPKEAVRLFKEGNGSILVGTVANYGEGIDLPEQMAPVIFFLRPGYPNPSDPMTIYEEKRYSGSRRWRIWNWRVMIEALQVRGRNIRSAEDLGVTVFISQQFRRFIPAVLPEWLKDSYRGDKKLEQAIEEIKKLLGRVWPSGVR